MESISKIFKVFKEYCAVISSIVSLFGILLIVVIFYNDTRQTNNEFPEFKQEMRNSFIEINHRIDSTYKVLNDKLDTISYNNGTLNLTVITVEDKVDGLTQSFTSFLTNDDNISKEDIIKYLEPIYSAMENDKKTTNSIR